MTERFYLPRRLFQLMMEHCRTERPLEACGIFAGEVGIGRIGYPMTNSKASPVAYQVDDYELSNAWADLTARRMQMVGIYHSHPTSPATPSRMDIQSATYPRAVYLIISFAESSPQVGAYRIVDGQFTEVELMLTDQIQGEWLDFRRLAEGRA